MTSVVKSLKDKELITPPSFLATNVHYEAMTGSISYGVSSDNSDMDVIGWCIPPKYIVFPHTAGFITGFGRFDKPEVFEQYQQHHIQDLSACKGKGQEYDVTIYNIVKYFMLCMECNPNMVDSLFVPSNCILHITQIGQMVREKRQIFLCKLAWHRFKGYAHSQIHKMENKNPEGKRKELVEQFGYDVKFAYHIVRLLGEIEQILTEGDLDLQRNREQLKAIRRGEWKQEEIIEYFNKREKELESVYDNSTLPHKPREAEIKELLLECLEHHYGSLDKCIVSEDKLEKALREISNIANKVLR